MSILLGGLILFGLVIAFLAAALGVVAGISWLADNAPPWVTVVASALVIFGLCVLLFWIGSVR